MGAVPSRGVGEGFTCLRVDQRDAFLAEAQGGLDRLVDAPTLRRSDLETVLDDLNHGRESLDGDRFVGASDGAVDPDAEIPLFPEEGEEIGGSARLG